MSNDPQKQKGRFAMRLVFAGPDAHGYEDSRARLVELFTGWADQRDIEVDPFTVGAALDFKADADGLLGRWTAGSLEKLLTDWFPRFVTLRECDRAGVPPTLHAWVDFLAEHGLLDARSEKPAALHAALERGTAGFITAMADRSRYGIAKFWTTTMLDHGVDPGDPENAEQFLTDLRAGRIEADMDSAALVAQKHMERELTGKPPGRLPPVLLAPEDELVTQAAGSPVLLRLRRFVDWVGAGRTLTTAGRLTLADAGELVGVLGTDDVLDPVIEGGAHRSRGSEELTGAHTLFQWAKAARLVRVVKGRLLPVKSAAPLLAAPMRLWERVFTSFVKIGAAVCSGGDDESMLRWWFEESMTAVYAALYQQIPLPRQMLDELVWETVMGAQFADVPDELHATWRLAVVSDFHTALDHLERLGVLERTVSTDSQEWEFIAQFTRDGAEPDHTLVRLTALGLWGVNRALRSLGAEAPVVGEMASETSEFMIASIADCNEQVVDAEFSAWCAARDDAAAATELAELIRRTDDPAHRALAFHALTWTGQAGLAAARTLRQDEGVGPLAAVWLAGQGVDPGPVSPTELLFAMVEQLSGLLPLGAPAVVDALASHSPEEQLEMLRKIHQIDHPRLRDVLDALVNHPDPTVARAAAKARLKSASR